MQKVGTTHTGVGVAGSVSWAPDEPLPGPTPSSRPTHLVRAARAHAWPSRACVPQPSCGHHAAFQDSAGRAHPILLVPSPGSTGQDGVLGVPWEDMATGRCL